MRCINLHFTYLLTCPVGPVTCFYLAFTNVFIICKTRFNGGFFNFFLVPFMTLMSLSVCLCMSVCLSVCLCMSGTTDRLSQRCCQLNCWLAGGSCAMTSSVTCADHVTHAPVECAMGQSWVGCYDHDAVAIRTITVAKGLYKATQKWTELNWNLSAVQFISFRFSSFPSLSSRLKELIYYINVT